MYQETIEKIILENEEIASFWSNTGGWAPEEAAELISKSRLDWQVELSKTLKKWDFLDAEHGQLILAWANLGALIEGTLKLCLSVYYLDYLRDDEKYERKGSIIDPDALALEKLKQFFKKKELLEEEWILYIDMVQQRRNAIHAFKDRPIGSREDFEKAVIKYLELINIIDSRLPYP